MEQEIDNLFLSDKSTNYTEKSILDLEDNVNNFMSIIPYVNLIEEKISSIDMNFELYHVKLERLANEMKDIESQNTKLENEILYQTSIYDRLKDLLIKLEIKEEYFIVLETESLETDGLIKIEEAVDVLENFGVEEYTIRVVKEKKRRVDIALSNFYNRFVNFITDLLKNEQIVSDFKVHDELYKKMERYKVLYKMSAKYDKIYSKLCDLYVKHAKIRYENELKIYLKKLHELNSESKKIENLENTIKTVLETYKYLIQVESNFLEKMSIKNDISEIFTNSNQAILNFFKDLYYLFQIETICFIDDNLKDSSEIPPFYQNFKEQLVILLGKLKKNFLQKEIELRDKVKGLERFEKYVKLSKMEDFNTILFRINLGRINSNSESVSLFEIIENKRLLENLKLAYNCDIEEYSEIDKENELKLERNVIDFVFEHGDPMNQIKYISKHVKGSAIFVKNVKEQIFEIIRDNLEDDKKEIVKNILLN